MESQVKSNIYFYSAFHNTDCIKAASQYQSNIITMFISQCFSN